MITEAILNLIFGLVYTLTFNLSSLTFDFDVSILEPFFDILGIILFILPPLSNFTAIFLFVSGVYAVRIVVAIYHLLPFCG